MSDNMDLYTAVRVLDSVDDSKLRNENVCRMTEEQIAEYSKQLDCVTGIFAKKFAQYVQGQQ